jgi:uncharacterized protein YegP (UPF0339 family)
MPDRAYLYRDDNKEFRWVRKSANGDRVGAATEGYRSKQHARENYERTSGPDAPTLEDLTDEEEPRVP